MQSLYSNASTCKSVGLEGMNFMVLDSPMTNAVSQCGNDYSKLRCDISEAANFATYFSGSQIGRASCRERV